MQVTKLNPRAVNKSAVREIWIQENLANVMICSNGSLVVAKNLLFIEDLRLHILIL